MTSPTSNNPQQPADSLTNRYTALQEAFTLANERFGEAVNAGDITQARALKNNLENALREFREEGAKEFTALNDGRVLHKREHEALKGFADSNQIELQRILSGVTITDGFVAEASFCAMGLTTLIGLEGLNKMVRLDVMHNSQLTSLTGIPVEALKVVYASRCKLTGDLSALKKAQSLTRLWVSYNPGLASLAGVPVQALEVLHASSCNLADDITALRNARKLRDLDLSFNRDLTSLTGVPVQALEKLDASYCGLTGDLTVLQNAQNLRELFVSSNRGLTSLTGVPVQALEALRASNCGLIGDLSVLQNAQKLRQLWVHDSRDRTSSLTKFKNAVKFRIMELFGKPGFNQESAQAVIKHLQENHALRDALI